MLQESDYYFVLAEIEEAYEDCYTDGYINGYHDACNNEWCVHTT